MFFNGLVSYIYIWVCLRIVHPIFQWTIIILPIIQLLFAGIPYFKTKPYMRINIYIYRICTYVHAIYRYIYIYPIYIPMTAHWTASRPIRPGPGLWSSNTPGATHCSRCLGPWGWADPPFDRSQNPMIYRVEIPSFWWCRISQPSTVY